MPNYLMDIQALEISFFFKIPKTLFYLSSTKNKCVVKSTRAVECLALLEELGNVIYLKHVPAVFLSNFYFQPNDSPSKTMKNVFYFI